MANKLLINERFITIQCDRNDVETVTLTQNIPYIHSNRILTEFKTTIRNIDIVLKLFRGIDYNNIEKAPTVIQQLFDKEMRRRIATKTLIDLGPTNEHPWLWRHQQLGRELAEVNDRYAFFYDTRTGKTPMSYQIILDDLEKNPNHKWLILCPLILIENAWLLDGKEMFPQIKVVGLHDSSKEKRLQRFAMDAQVYVTNIESFIAYEEYVRKLPIHGCVVDESSAMKSSSSKFGKAAVEYSSTMKRWYLLSGTPAPNGEWEYYRQLQSVDFYGVHPSWSQFKMYFFNNVSRNPQYEKLQTKPERQDELLGLLKEYSIYVDKEDVLTTPGREFIEYEFKMPETLATQYHKLRQEMYLELGDNVMVTASSTAAKLNKLNQVTSGFIIDTAAKKRNAYNDTNEEETYLLDEYRFNELYKLLATIGDNQVMIWANYHKEFEMIQRHLGSNCGCIYGKTNIDEKNQNIRNFKDGKIQYLVCHPKSADKGLTLTNAHFAVYFSMGYSYEAYKQSIERIYGDIIKQKHFCRYYILVAKGTVDKAIYNAVATKGDMSMIILNHLKGGL